MLTGYLAPLLLLYLLVNAAVFCVYGWDKRAARLGERRIRETTLLLIAFAGGGVGAFAAQRLLRHKTRKSPFRFALPLLCMLQVILLAAVVAASGDNILRQAFAAV